jgi:hypothetical protein
MATVTTATIPVTSSFDQQGEVSGTRRDHLIHYNNLLITIARLGFVFTSDGVLRATALSTGTTNTLATSACTITISGVPVVVAAQTAQAMTASTALPAGKWTVIGIDAVAAGTITMVYSSTIGTGQATEAAAITDALTNVAKTAAKARIGYIAVQAAAAATWTAGTDGFTLGSGGTVAQSTNFYNIASPFELVAVSANAALLGSIGFTTKQIGNMAGTSVSV